MITMNTDSLLEGIRTQTIVVQFTVLSRICLDGLKKTKITQDSHVSGRDSIRRPAKYGSLRFGTGVRGALEGIK